MEASTFPHHYADGYVVTNMVTTGWIQIFFAGLYRETNTMPYQWNPHMKKHKPVALFISSEWRTSIKEEGKLWYGCDMRYRYSAN